MVDVVVVDVGLEGALPARDQIGIAGGVDDDLGEDRVTAFLALEDRALDDVVLDDRRRGPGVQQQPHLGLAHHLHGQRLERLGIDGRRPGDDAVVGGRALRPVGGGRRILASPQSARGGPWIASFGRRSIRSSGDAADDVPAGPIRHAVDPDDEAAGRQAAQVVVALDQQHVGAEAGRSDGSGRSGRAAADHQHVGLGEDRNFARRLEIVLAGRERRTRLLPPNTSMPCSAPMLLL